MTGYLVIVTDQPQPELAGHDGTSYQSPALSGQSAQALARALVGAALDADQHGPWRQTRPGRTRTVRIEPAP